MISSDHTQNEVTLTQLGWITSASEAELFGVAGGILLGDGLGFGGRDDEQNGSFARDWFDARIEGFRAAICTSELFRGLGGDLANDILTLVPVLAPGLDGNSLLAAIVAGIVLRRGIAQFCALG